MGWLEMLNYLFPWAILIIMFVLGLVCVCWPEKVREYSIKRRTSAWGFYRSLYEWIESSDYLVTIRLIGAILLVVIILFSTIVVYRRLFR